MTLLPALAFGFALGLRHATDADHIAAIGTLSGGAQSTRRAAALGASWGIGHSTSILLVGGLLVLLRLPMPPRVALAFEFAVALMLIGLGVRSLFAKRRAETPGGARPFLVGVVHGLAGSAVLVLLVLGTTSSALAAAVYLVCFCAGSTAGMAFVTMLLALPGRMKGERASGFNRAVRLAAGVASIVIGVALAHQVGVEDGLFAATVTSAE